VRNALASLILFVATLLAPLFAAHAQTGKRSRSDRDINAIGHREILHGQERTFIPSPDKERDRGAQYLAAFQRSGDLILDPEITTYLSALAQSIDRNSDAHMPVTVVVVDSNAVNACTSPGGYQYITRGLLIQAASEGELAAVFAHGLAQTALHVPARQELRQTLLAIFPPAPGTISVFACTSQAPLSLARGVRRADEFDADYFGVQYLYKSGYDPEYYLRFVQRIWPTGQGSAKMPVAFSRFPSVVERLKMLRGEIAAILPPRDPLVVSTAAFDEFQVHLHLLPPMPPEPDEPTLRRLNTSQD
jgi:beta-barrel assembly-enhancing protease